MAGIDAKIPTVTLVGACREMKRGISFPPMMNFAFASQHAVKIYSGNVIQSDLTWSSSQRSDDGLAGTITFASIWEGGTLADPDAALPAP
jgi:hypothetical protein